MVIGGGLVPNLQYEKVGILSKRPNLQSETRSTIRFLQALLSLALVKDVKIDSDKVQLSVWLPKGYIMFFNKAALRNNM